MVSVTSGYRSLSACRQAVVGSPPPLVVSQCTADHTNNNNQDGTGAGKQPPRCPQEEDEADEGGDGEVQGGERGHGEEAPGGDSPARGGEFATSVNLAYLAHCHQEQAVCKNLTRVALRGNPLKLVPCCRELWHAAALASAVAAGVGPWVG